MFSLVGWTTIVVTRPLTACETLVVCPLGIGAGPRGVHGATSDGLRGALKADAPVAPDPVPAPVLPEVDELGPFAPLPRILSRMLRSLSLVSRMAWPRARGSKRLSIKPRR